MLVLPLQADVATAAEHVIGLDRFDEAFQYPRIAHHIIIHEDDEVATRHFVPSCARPRTAWVPGWHDPHVRPVCTCPLKQFLVAVNDDDNFVWPNCLLP